MPTLDSYLNLITSEHRSKPNFIAVVTALLQGVIGDSNLESIMPSLYDIDVAIGSQLDVVGQWVGLGREVEVYTPGTYFAFDTPGVGFDQGIWRSSLTSEYSTVSLPDDIYRLMLRIKIAINYWHGSFLQAEELLKGLGQALSGNFIYDPYILGIFPAQNELGQTVFFDLAGNVITVTDPHAEITNVFPVEVGYRIFMIDNMDMSITIGISGTIPSNLIISMFKTSALFLKPEGVRIKEIIAVTANNTPLFGFDLDNEYIGGFDAGSWGNVYFQEILDTVPKFGFDVATIHIAGFDIGTWNV